MTGRGIRDRLTDMVSITDGPSRQLAVATDPIQGATPVSASPRELSRVLMNLLDNAVRHSPEGSTVRVIVGSGSAATVTIADEGPGFPGDFLVTAFQSFTRADQARARDGAGAGRGLAIAKGLVEAHGGAIAAQPGPGGVVTIRLPRTPEAPAR